MSFIDCHSSFVPSCMLSGRAPRCLCRYSHLPKIYQAFLMSATLSDEVKMLKKLLLHNAVSRVVMVTVSRATVSDWTTEMCKLVYLVSTTHVIMFLVIVLFPPWPDLCINFIMAQFEYYFHHGPICILIFPSWHKLNIISIKSLVQNYFKKAQMCVLFPLCPDSNIMCDDEYLVWVVFVHISRWSWNWKSHSCLSRVDSHSTTSSESHCGSWG